MADHPSAMRHKGRLVILDSDSEEDNAPSPPPPVASKPSCRDSLDFLSDSDDELEGLMQSMKVTDEEKKIQKEGLNGVMSTLTRQLSSSSSSSGSEEASYQEEESMDDSLADEDDVPDTDPNSAWEAVYGNKEVYLSRKKNTEYQWPNFRIPTSLFNKLYDFQRTGVQWMAGLYNARIRGGVLGDDMGMGKTFMTLTYIGGLMRAGTISNALILAPLSVLRSWEREAMNVLRQCVPDVEIKILQSEMSKKQRDHILDKALDRFTRKQYLIITTYGMVRSATKSFQSYTGHWHVVVLDEGHQTKNHASQISQVCRTICENPETRRIMLTGTPIMNNLKELWTLFDWTSSGQLLGELKPFIKHFAKPIEAARDKKATNHEIQEGLRKNHELQGLLKPYFLQRLKADYLADKLPEKQEVVVWTHLSAEQREIYESFLGSKDVKLLLRGGQHRTISALEGITWLKKLCGHPILVDDSEDKVDVANILGGYGSDGVAKLVKQSAKLGILADLVPNLCGDGHKTLIFSQSTMMLDIIQKVLAAKGVGMERIDGQTREKDRQRLVDEFNSDDSEFQVMLLSTKAAGVGLTLVGADRVIVYDPSWTPAEDSQAVDRAFRIGQTRPVVVYRLITGGTIEETMYAKQQHKEGIKKTVLGAEGESVARYFDQKDLRKAFSLAAPGVCETMDKAEQESRNLTTDWSKHEFLHSHRGVVGLSRHDGFYSAPAPSDPAFAPATPFTGPKLLGRAQRVLAKDNFDDLLTAKGTHFHPCHLSPVPRSDNCKTAGSSADSAIVLAEDGFVGKADVLIPSTDSSPRSWTTVEHPKTLVERNFVHAAPKEHESGGTQSDFVVLSDEEQSTSPANLTVFDQETEHFIQANEPSVKSPPSPYESDFVVVADNEVATTKAPPVEELLDQFSTLNVADEKEEPADSWEQVDDGDDYKSGDDDDDYTKENDGEYQMKNAAEAAFELATKLREEGKPKQSLNLLVGIAKNGYDVLNQEEKLALHSNIVQSAAQTGLLAPTFLKNHTDN